MNQLIRELIDIGLKTKAQQKSVPAYEYLATRASVETLILLRKMIEDSSPELIEIAKEMANHRLNQEDLNYLFVE